jgi:hypothetical protein
MSIKYFYKKFLFLNKAIKSDIIIMRLFRKRTKLSAQKLFPLDCAQKVLYATSRFRKGNLLRQKAVKQKGNNEQ